MMVTFICECEKKALDRTRRVLDAFANRIGSRTWQTVITEDGLQAVKKLLRKTATKNTAVACHWIRSRSRSDLLWVVGNKDKFNSQGIVPVNYTNGELIMDKIAVNTEALYANTLQQPLSEHLFAVGYLAYCLIKRVVDDDKLAKAVYVAGCLHDIGKIDPQFQTWLAGKLQKKKKTEIEIPEEGQHIDTAAFSFENHPRHNEISLLLYHLLDDDGFKQINKSNKARIKHALYWHHAKPIRKLDLKTMEMIYKKLQKNIGNTEFPNFISAVGQIIKNINDLSRNYISNDALIIEGINRKTDEDKIYDLGQTKLPDYKKYSPDNSVSDYLGNIKENANNNIARAAVITADRLISALSKEQLDYYLKEQTLETLLDDKLTIQSDLPLQIQSCLTAFSQSPNADNNRNQQQSLAAQKLAQSNSDNSQVKVLQGPAGCGKTKIALEWAVNTNAQQILWICPRVLICEGLIADLISQNYLPNSKIEIYTGEFKYLYQAGEKRETPDNEVFTGDIIITTIDQITNSITTHKKIESFINYMNAHIVFDEYHEYINMPAFNLLFAELVECKAMQKQQGKTILVSATPNYYFVEQFLDIHRDDIVTVPSFNTSQYQIEFKTFDERKLDDSNPFYQIQPAQSFVISNTVITAQRSFIFHQQQENAILLHSKFKKSDKAALFEKTLQSFGQNGTKEYDLLRSGPIVQAALNISCQQMVTEFTHAENWLQRLGRLNRFNEYQAISHYITATPETLANNGKQQGGCARFLNSSNTLQSAKKWYEFLQDKITDKPVTISEIYQLYQDFYNNSSCLAAIEQDFIAALKKSVQVIDNKLIDPVTLPRKPTQEKMKIKKSSLRGDNRFVQMAVCLISDKDNISFPNQYAYDETDYDGELTAPVEDICGYGNAAQNLLAFMVKKHHNIKDTKKAYKDSILLNEARSAETPIYLSYVPSDLKIVEAQPHSYAIYYAQGYKQPIGAISLNKLNQAEE